MAQVSSLINNKAQSQLLEIAQFDSKFGKITMVDDTSEADVTYVGVAKRGAIGSDPIWFITKIDESAENPVFPDTNMTVTTSEYNVAWDNRLFIPYNNEDYETFDVTFDETFG